MRLIALTLVSSTSSSKAYDKSVSTHPFHHHQLHKTHPTLPILGIITLNLGSLSNLGNFSIFSATFSKNLSARSPARGAQTGAANRMAAGAATALPSKAACWVPVMRIVGTAAGTLRGTARMAVANIIVGVRVGFGWEVRCGGRLV